MKPPFWQQLPIALRAYVQPASSVKNAEQPEEKKKFVHKQVKPSDYALIFDTETTTDASQKLRFGTYQVRKAGVLREEGIFYNPKALDEAERTLLRKHAEELNRHEFKLMTVDVFIEDVFFLIGYKWRGHIIGFNLPFDISRLAIHHGPARGTMLGGFSFKLSPHRFWPHVQVKHLSSRDSIIRFSALKKLDSKGDRNKGRKYATRRGFFVDMRTQGAALTSESHSLDSLAKYLGIPSQKFHGEHGKKLDVEYITYALRDTQTTWECFELLRLEYEKHGLSLTPLHTIHTEASLGKAYLKEMGIRPWRELQPDFPPELLGIIASSYYGGRSEVKHRRQVTQILYCDFLSMYPTVCTLMGLWNFVIAENMQWKDCTEETQRFLGNTAIDDWQTPECWKSLCVLVQVMPDDEIYPVRARYGDDAQYTIGTNHLRLDTPIWYTLADCVSAKLLSGKTPHIFRAIRFTPGKQQPGLRPVNIAGNADYYLNPKEGDFFKRLIDLRTQVKKKLKAYPEQKPQLNSQQLTLKILANATSYGIFIELLVKQCRASEEVLCYGPLDEALSVKKNKLEIPGTYFHPLLATLITGAARLMLGIAEHLVLKAGLDWAFCDTDSMALAKPENMSQEKFYSRSKKVQEWFTPLNPYAEKQPLFKIEDDNYHPETGALHPLYCLAISSKRYALFNWDNGVLCLRKVSAHGLGHLVAPYQRERTMEDLYDVELWQQDFWRVIIKATLNGNPDCPDYNKLLGFHAPAVSRYAATTPLLERWFKRYNLGKEYENRVGPFNFLLAAQMKGRHEAQDFDEEINDRHLRPVAPFGKNLMDAIKHCFDRHTGTPITAEQLKTYHESLNRYHLHPESKFLNGDFIDSGITERRHITGTALQFIGKEANQWEEQLFLGFNPDAQLEYGTPKEQYLKILQEAKKTFGLRRLAREAGCAPRHLNEVIRGKVTPGKQTLERIYKVIHKLSDIVYHY